MVVLRLTQKLLRLVGTPTTVATPSTTILGDWTGNIFYVGRKRYVLLISEHSRLPVLMPGRDLKNLGCNFPGALAEVLLALDIPLAAIEREVDAAIECVIATTNSRSLLGTINDYTFMVSFRLRDHPEMDLAQAALFLSDTPVGPLGYDRPGRVARRMLEYPKPVLLA